MTRVLGLAVAVALTSCVSERSKAIPRYDGPLLSRDGASSARPPREASIEPESLSTTPAAFVVPEPPPAVRSSGYAGHRPIPAGVSIEQLARERFLASETSVVAREVTLHVPARYAAEASLRGASVTQPSAGRRVAIGDAVLTLRRLTVRAAKVTLVARSSGPDDVQLSARGDVSFRSDQPASVLDEKGLRSLLLRNDAHTPLR